MMLCIGCKATTLITSTLLQTSHEGFSLHRTESRALSNPTPAAHQAGFHADDRYLPSRHIPQSQLPGPTLLAEQPYAITDLAEVLVRRVVGSKLCQVPWLCIGAQQGFPSVRVCHAGRLQPGALLQVARAEPSACATRPARVSDKRKASRSACTRRRGCPSGLTNAPGPK